MSSGRILKGIGGFYYIEGEHSLVECRARGSLRKKGLKPAVGDIARYTEHSQGYGSLDAIEERKNYLIRPPVANIDRMFIVMAAARPEPVLLLIDKISAVCVKNQMEPCVIINKCDLAKSADLREIYESAGFPTLSVSAETGEGLDRIPALIEGKICAFCGNSGVGKSSIVNAVTGRHLFETGEVGRTERGRHTTRHVELVPACGGYIADTPGFSDLDFARFRILEQEELDSLFPEIGAHKEECRYTGCNHIGVDECAVYEAVRSGEIPKSRYESYCAIYSEIGADKPYGKR